MSRLFRFSIIMFVSVFFFTGWSLAYAQQRLDQGSLGISPFLVEAVVAPGGTYEAAIEVFNNTALPLPIAVSINDFVPSGEHGSVRFLDAGQVSHPSFSLASWINITGQPEFIIPAHDKTTVVFTVTAPVDAEPGTHYGGLLFSAREATPGSSGTVVVKKVGALFLIKTGSANASGNIAGFTSQKRLYADSVVKFNTIFENTGNVHVQPKGQITVRNIFGKEVGEAYVNENAQFVLPQTTRKFASSFLRRWLFGRYTADLTVWYGSPKLEAHAHVTFWVVPVKKLGIYIGAFVLLLAACYIGITRYNAWLIRNRH